MLAAMASWSASVVELSLVVLVKAVSGNSVWSVVAGIGLVFSMLSGCRFWYLYERFWEKLLSAWPWCRSFSGWYLFVAFGISRHTFVVSCCLRLLFGYRLVNSSWLISIFSKIYEEMF